jgi:flagellar assembly protein FliH
MSSSPRRALVSPPAPRPSPGAQLEVSPFPYSEVAGSTSQPLPGRGGSDSPALVAQVAEREARARELGRQQGELEARAKFEELLGRERASVATALTDFARERAGYYQRVEEEAVQLALSIARKVLHREAQVDPLLLMGIARVALEKIEGATGMVLAVHPQQAAEWRRYLAGYMEPGALPEIVEDPALAIECCQLRTSMGTAELGMEVQLKEIEHGLMDLLAARPREQKPEQKKDKP